MPALLRELLVLELDPRNPGGLVAAHGVGDVQQAAVAGVGVGDHGGRGHVGHGTRAIHHIGVGANPRVGDSQVGGDGSVARHVEAVEAKTVGQPGGDHLEDARGDRELTPADPRRQGFPLGRPG